MTRRVVAIASLTAMVSAAAAQVRDPRPVPATGTSTLAGRVITTDDPPVAVRRARITVTAANLVTSRSVLTDDDGRFVVADLPAGRYTISATKAALLRSSFGAVRPTGPGTAVVVAAGQTVSDLTLRMARGGVISGIVTDADGRAARGVPIRLQQMRTMAGARELTTIGLSPGVSDAVTDDRGEYRLFGLAPGDYYVSAAPHDAGMGLTRTADGRTVGAVPIYFPGAASAAEARPVSVELGGDVTGIDLRLARVPTAHLAGSIVPLPDVNPADVRLTLAPQSPADPQTGTVTTLAGTLRAVNGVRPDWTFSYTGVVPGTYRLTARVVRRPADVTASTSYLAMLNGETTFWAAADIAVNGVDVTGVALQLQPPMTVSGRVVLRASGAGPAPDLTRVRVSLSSVSRADGLAIAAPSVSATAAGQFTVAGVTPGLYRVTAYLSGADSGRWTVESSIAGGRDTLDFPVEIKPYEELGGVVVTLTDATQRLSGQLQDAAGRPATAFTIVIFPADAAMWRSPRRIRTVRPGHDGRYAISNLAAGEYRVAAVFDIGPDEVFDPAFLGSLSAAALPVTLKPGEGKVQDFRIAK